MKRRRIGAVVSAILGAAIAVAAGVGLAVVGGGSPNPVQVFVAVALMLFGGLFIAVGFYLNARPRG